MQHSKKPRRLHQTTALTPYSSPLVVEGEGMEVEAAARPSADWHLLQSEQVRQALTYLIKGFIILGGAWLFAVLTAPLTHPTLVACRTVITSITVVVGLVILGGGIYHGWRVFHAARKEHRMDDLEVQERRAGQARSVYYADANGNYPHIHDWTTNQIVITPAGQIAQPPEMESRIWQARRAEEQYARERLKRIQLEEQMEAARIGPPEPGSMLSLPEYVLYEEVLPQIPQGHALIGVSGSGVETRTRGTCRPLLWIVGGSGTGKTNSVVLRVEEDYQRKHGLLVIDPHAFKGDSLYNAIQHYEDSFIRPMAQETDEIKGVLDWFLEEFKLRKVGRGRYQGPITLLVDEVGSLTNGLDTDEEKEVARKLKEVARICGQESRGFELFGVFISQDAANLAWLRRRASLIIAHQMTMMSERLLVCNEDRIVARSMDTWPRGRTYIYGLAMPEGPQVLQQPVVRAASQGGYHDTAPHFFSGQPAQKIVESDPLMTPVEDDAEPDESCHDTPHDTDGCHDTISSQDQQIILEAAQMQQEITGNQPVNKRQLLAVLRDTHGPYWNANRRTMIRHVLDEAGIPQR